MRVGRTATCSIRRLRPPKHDPGREIVREVLKTMNQAGGREQDVADTKRLALKRGIRLTNRKHALARHDDVKLVLIVRSLFIPALGSVVAQPHRAVCHHLRRPAPGGDWRRLGVR